MRLLALCTVSLLMFASSAAHAVDLPDCSFNGIRLNGTVQIVETFADITVRVVDVFGDLYVKFVDALPVRCGEWQIVESLPDFTIKYVDSFADIDIRVVDVFPGVQ